ncbi:MAG: helix-turn-helix transcriptional regulator [bacterium]
MIKRFQELELNNIMDKIGTLFYKASISIGIEDFAKYFTISRISNKFDDANPKYLYGKSSQDIFDEVLSIVGIDYTLENEIPKKNKYYWIGSILAYYHFHSNKSYDEILYSINFETLLKSYNVYHEMDIKQTYDFFQQNFFNKTMLQVLRDRNNLTQLELSKKSNVNIRNIQLYEQRQNNINKANALTLFNLSKVLNCKVEDLLEFNY